MLLLKDEHDEEPEDRESWASCSERLNGCIEMLYAVSFSLLVVVTLSSVVSLIGSLWMCTLSVRRLKQAC